MRTEEVSVTGRSEGGPAPAGGGAPGTRPGRRVVVLTTEEEVRALAPQWEALAPCPNADPEFFLTVVRARSEVVGPYVFALLDGDVLEALLAARLEEIDYRCDFGYRTVYRKRIRALSMIHGGAVRVRPDVPWEPLVEALAHALGSGVAAAAYFRNIEVDSELLNSIREIVPRSRRYESANAELHWFLDLPESFDALLARVGGRVRQTLRRRRKVLERDFPGRVVVRKTTEPGEVPEFCRRAEVVAAGTYQRGLGAGFVHNPEYEARLGLAARRGRLRAYELEVDGRVRSFWIGELAGNVHHLDSTGYENDFGRFAPGTVLRLEVMRDMIEEGRKGVDFGFGDADYKRHFDARSWRECDVFVFAPGLRGMWLHTVRRAVTWAAQRARAVVAWLRLEDRLRKAMRRSVAGRAEGAEGSPAAEETGPAEERGE